MRLREAGEVGGWRGQVLEQLGVIEGEDAEDKRRVSRPQQRAKQVERPRRGQAGFKIVASGPREGDAPGFCLEPLAQPARERTARVAYVLRSRRPRPRSVA